ncbi:MAG TPA: hypothetical protein VGH21_00675, partial [Solirubrobacteraceae bacterium]
CALGLAAAAPRHDVSRTVMLHGSELSVERIRAVRNELIERAELALAGERADVRITYELRYVGQSFELPVEQPPTTAADSSASAPDPQSLSEAFAALHEQRYGYRDDDADVELVNVRVSAWGPAPELLLRANPGPQASQSSAQVVFNGAAQPARVLRGELAPGTRIVGPAVCALSEATLLVPPGWSGVVDQQGTCVLHDDSGSA